MSGDNQCRRSGKAVQGPNIPICGAPTSEKINFSYYILLHLITSYSSYFGGKKGISGNKTSFFLLMVVVSPSHRLWFCRCHRGVAFLIALSRCHCCSHVVVVPLLLHCHGFVIAIAVSPSSSHCFVVTIVVSPSHLSRFRHCHCGVAFMLVTVSLLPLWCRLHIGRGFVVAVAVSPSCRSQFHHCHCSVAFTSVTVSSLPLQCRLHHRIVTVLLSSRCCLHRRIVAVSSSRFHHCHCGVAFTSVTVSLLPSWCRLHHCIVAVSSSQSCRCGAFTVASLQFRRRCCGVTFIVASSRCCRYHFVVAVTVSLSQFHHRLVVLLL